MYSSVATLILREGKNHGMMFSHIALIDIYNTEHQFKSGKGVSGLWLW